jgi:hypothetical protein
MISRANISKELTPNLGNSKRRESMGMKITYKELNDKKKTKKKDKKAKGGMTLVGLSPAEEKRSGTASQAARKRSMKKGGTAKLAAGGQGYKAREDESIAMRIPRRRSPRQLAASRDDSYGRWGSGATKRGRINLSSGGMAQHGHGAKLK